MLVLPPGTPHAGQWGASSAGTGKGSDVVVDLFRRHSLAIHCRKRRALGIVFFLEGYGECEWFAFSISSTIPLFPWRMVNASGSHLAYPPPFLYFLGGYGECEWFAFSISSTIPLFPWRI
jgi:hypothetical protein